MTEKEFEEALYALNIELSKEKKEQLSSFYQFLIEKNKNLNLTRITSKEDVYLKHFYDSLTLSKIVNFNEIETLCDVGSGAGFPGIVLKIVYPHLEVVLLDALQKRVNYLNELIDYLNLKNIKAIHVRSEDYHEKKFDIVTARAVASLEKLLPTCMPLLNEKGKFIAMKANVDEELQKSLSMMKKKKIHLQQKVSFLLPVEKSQRTLLEFIKR